MPFDFFNVSHLAFGSKLTKAFTLLDRLRSEGDETLQTMLNILDVYGEYLNRNYPAPQPTRPDAPVRSNEILDLLNDGNTLKSLYLTDDEEPKLHVDVNIFKRATNRFTIASGETELKEGYCFVTQSISNSQPNRDVQFVEDYADGVGNFLFQFRIDPDNNINVIGNDYNYFLPGGLDHIYGMEQGETVLTDCHTSTDKKSYTAEDYEAIVCVGYGRWGDNWQYTDGSTIAWAQLTVDVNGSRICDINGKNQKQYIVVYLKPGDVLTGDIKKAFKVKYNQTYVNPEVMDEITYSGSTLQVLRNAKFYGLNADNTSYTVGRLSSQLNLPLLNYDADDIETNTGINVPATGYFTNERFCIKASSFHASYGAYSGKHTLTTGTTYARLVPATGFQTQYWLDLYITWSNCKPNTTYDLSKLELYWSGVNRYGHVTLSCDSGSNLPNIYFNSSNSGSTYLSGTVRSDSEGNIPTLRLHIEPDGTGYGLDGSTWTLSHLTSLFAPSEYDYSGYRFYISKVAESDGTPSALVITTSESLTSTFGYYGYFTLNNDGSISSLINENWIPQRIEGISLGADTNTLVFAENNPYNIFGTTSALAPNLPVTGLQTVIDNEFVDIQDIFYEQIGSIPENKKMFLGVYPLELPYLLYMKTTPSQEEKSCAVITFDEESNMTRLDLTYPGAGSN